MLLVVILCLAHKIQDRLALVRERQRTGAAFIIVEQNLGFLREVMDDVMVLDHGRCVLQGAAAAYSREALERHLMV
ncbi:MAG: hypothetical protein OJF60_001470 [Burkholderiaceae bacterium]|jgi:branched-chain amino acid transport system ATP-binding protein|nr:MAG: hypothetical protein OJF60_001470 [Burkholderiaceae bacterium]